MTIVVLLLLAVVWAAVLGPGLIRRRAEARSANSIGAFHRQLRVLRRSGPVTVAPVHHLRPAQTGVGGMSTHAVPGSRPGLILIRPDTLAPVLMAPESAAPAAVSAPTGRRPDPYFRPEACRRRRDVLLALAGGFFLTLFLGLVPTLQPLLYLSLVLLAGLAAYVVMLVRLRNLAVEREAKLHWLPETADMPTGVERRVAAR